MSSSSQIFRLSPQQRQLWTIQGANALVYGARLDLSITGPLDTEGLGDVLRQIVQRHEMLRTSFELQPGMKVPVQVIGDEPVLFSNLVKVSPKQHVLQLSLPSLCADSRTIRNLATDVSNSYCTGNGHGPGRDEPFQYMDFSEWQHQLLEADDEDARTGKEYWAKHVPPAVEWNLPLGFEGSELDLPPERVSFSITPDLLQTIERTASQAQVSIGEILLACWQVLLWRYTGKERFAVGGVIDGRKFEELEQAYGPYSRILPIIFQHIESMRFSDVLTETQRCLREAKEWQEYFVPAFNEQPATIGYEFHEGSKVFNAENLEFCITLQQVWSYPFRLKLDCWRTERDLECDLYFRSDCFDRKSVERIAANLQMLLKSASTKPTTAIDQLSLLSPAERQELINFNNCSGELPRASVIDRFEAQVQLTPSRTAVVFMEQQLTYDELNSKANKVAHCLRKLGVGPDVTVGLCVDPSVEMLIGLLGVLKAGGAYVPLNPHHPSSRLSYQIAETGISVLLTSARSKSIVGGLAAQIIELDSPQPKFDNEPESNPVSRVDLDNACYVIYTSGSTGNPKGVAVTHQSLANYTEFIVGRLQTADMRSLQYAIVSTIAADLGNTTIFPCLTSGGCLHILPFEIATDGRRFAAYNQSQAIDVLKIVPSHLEALTSAAEGANVLPRHVLVLGGEALSLRLLNRLWDQRRECRILNHYGPTETTVGSLTFDCSETLENKSSQASVPVGSPIKNTQAYILDRHLEPMPCLVAGDLYLAGIGVARGYLNQPATTSDRFIPNPFSRAPGERMYSTGDRARYLADGTIEFLGRSDRQLKIRGFRIEPEEIETILAKHPAVRRCVVAPTERGDGDLRLAAYVVLSEGVQSDELRTWLSTELPDYMVPSQFITLKVLPLTRNGKVDYDSLAEIAKHESMTGRPMVAPRTVFEEDLAGMWREMLKVESVGVTDNFFELGGHSLLVTQIVSRIRKHFGVELSLSTFFETRTIEQLALRIENAKAEQTTRFLTELEHISDEEAKRLLEDTHG